MEGQRFGQYSQHNLEAEMKEGIFVYKSTKNENLVTKIWTIMLPGQADMYHISHYIRSLSELTPPPTPHFSVSKIA